MREKSGCGGARGAALAERGHQSVAGQHADHGAPFDHRKVALRPGQHQVDGALQRIAGVETRRPSAAPKEGAGEELPSGPPSSAGSRAIAALYPMPPSLALILIYSIPKLALRSMRWSSSSMDICAAWHTTGSVPSAPITR